MENEQLNKLIENILNTEELGEKEKQLLLEKAAKFGLDPIEFEKALNKKWFEKNSKNSSSK